MGLDALTLHRWGRSFAGRSLPLAETLLRAASRILFGAYVPPQARIGEGTFVGYGGTGVFIHPDAALGRHCLISPYVSIGGCAGNEGAAQVGDYVRIGVGARILGPVRIGAFAVVGANSVVTRDVPAGTVVFGVPARVVRTMADPAGEYERDLSRRVPAADRPRVPVNRAAVDRAPVDRAPGARGPEARTVPLAQVANAAELLGAAPRADALPPLRAELRPDLRPEVRPGVRAEPHAARPTPRRVDRT